MRASGNRDVRESGKRKQHRCLLLMRVFSSALLLAASSPARAQVRLVELVNADRVEVEADSTQGTVRRLFGNVVLRQDTTTLYAARAVQYEQRGQVFLEGDVRIESGKVTLTAPRVTYDANAKEAMADQNVRIEDEETVLLAPSARYLTRTEQAFFDAGGRLLHDGAELTAPRGTYDANRKEAVFEGGVQLQDSSAVLISERGTYNANAERADFVGAVRLRQRGVALYADSLVHFRETERSEAFGQVVLERLGDARDEADGGEAPDSTRRTLLFGASATHDERARTSHVEGTEAREPLLVQLRTVSTGITDTTLVRAHHFDAVQRDSLGGTFTRVVAVGVVRLVQPRLSAIADSAAFERVELGDSTRAIRDRLALHGQARPSIWFDEAQITGDTLYAFAVGEALEHLDVLGDAFVAQLDTTLGRVRQMRGRQMQARFIRDSLRTLAIWPNAEAIYFRATEDGLLDGADRLSADSLAFLFADDALREIRGARDIEGIAYGPQIVPEPFHLPGYVYTPDQRPLRPALLTSGSWEADWLDAQHPEPDLTARPPLVPLSSETPEESGDS